MKLNIFSPLPPDPEPAAQALGELLPELRQRAELTLWTNQEAWDPALEDEATVRRYPCDDFWPAVNAADLTVFHLGRDAGVYGEILLLSRRHPGLLVLHDGFFHELVAGVLLGFQADETAYRAAMGTHGEDGRRAADEVVAGWPERPPAADRLSLLPYVTAPGLGVLVHDEQTLRALPEGAPRAMAPLPRAVRAGTRPRSPGDTLRLAALVDATSPCGELFVALAALAAEEGLPAFHLEVHGAVGSDLLRRAPAALGIASRVSFHDGGSAEALDGALAKAGLAVNLRNRATAPWHQLRIWDHGVPALVTPASCPGAGGDTAVLIDRWGDPVALLRTLRSFLQDPASFGRIGEWGREALVARHAPRDYVDRLLELAGQAVGYRRGLAGRHAVARVAGFAEDWPDAARGTVAASVETAVAQLFSPGAVLKA